jgi:ribonuclease HI
MGRVPMSSGTFGGDQVGGVGLKVRVWVDGGSRGNPGLSGIGVLVENMAGATLATISQGIGVTTNNVAEYRALLAGLEKAQALGATVVEVVSDSELLVRQMLGQYRVKNAGLRPLHFQARQMASQFAEFNIRHLSRDHNAKADGLVNRALDEDERAGL